MQSHSIAGAVAACLLLGACAADIHRTPTSFVPHNGPARTVTVARDVEIAPGNSYRRTLKAGSTWKQVGRVPQGTVFEIDGDVFMLEAKHMHQAHCVLSDDLKLVGFFLPVEQSFVPLSPAVSLPVTSK